MSDAVNRYIYMFQIDKHGDISAHLEDYIQGFEAYSAAICLDLRKAPITKPVNNSKIQLN